MLKVVCSGDDVISGLGGWGSNVSVGFLYDTINVGVIWAEEGWGNLGVVVDVRGEGGGLMRLPGGGGSIGGSERHRS